MTYEDQAAHISALLKDRLGVRGRDLESRLRRAGRLLPRDVRRDAQTLIDAVRLQANPKLARMVDEASVQRAFDNSETYLQSVDVSKRRTDRVIGVLATIAFHILVVGAIFLAVAVWRELL